ncbi:MAG: hypothetical protein QOG52_648 [Frankiaceae bacterium]|jgi:hypothetical protein|nr:hypothetical protein [Frankiaceae bacterium]
MTPPTDRQLAHWAAIAAVYTAVALLLYVAGGLVRPESAHGDELGAVALVLWLLIPMHDGLRRLLNLSRRIGPSEGCAGWMWDAMCGRTVRRVHGLAWLAGATVVVDGFAVGLGVLTRSNLHQCECALSAGVLWTIAAGTALLVRRHGWQRIDAPLPTQAAP